MPQASNVSWFFSIYYVFFFFMMLVMSLNYYHFSGYKVLKFFKNSNFLFFYSI